MHMMVPKAFRKHKMIKFLKNISDSLVDKCSESFINCMFMRSFEHSKMCGILPHICVDLGHQFLKLFPNEV